MTNIQLEFEKKTNDILIWKGQVVMSRSEEPYFKAIFSRLADLQPKKVLEIGFGLGISAELIQKHLNPQLHDIYEIESSIYRDLEEFSVGRPSVRTHLGDWRRQLIKQKYDFIFFDPFDYTEAGGGNYEKWIKSRAQMAELMKKLLTEEGVLCHPHFGDGDVPGLSGFTTIIVERLKVSPILMSDETICEEAAVILHKPNK
ncbi:spermidine synthase family protein [Planctobacterium marinum]|uniref:hypothetical protein n=1 Tax=Planctobacterium marinum TaxID=1631968 RepID=UPI001E4D20D7|nr:hypothetical protein [Planctobacterium marinum]MCC2606576.1 hypothetical protein [Planctobacterium marinum]